MKIIRCDWCGTSFYNVRNVLICPCCGAPFQDAEVFDVTALEPAPFYVLSVRGRCTVEMREKIRDVYEKEFLPNSKLIIVDDRISVSVLK